VERVLLQEVAVALGLPPGGTEGIMIESVSTDTRTIDAGALFFALRGERFDGHDHVGEAFSRGAAAAVVSRDVGETVGPVFAVDDTVEALQDLATWYRGRFVLDVVAVTGTNGKTTTKEMTADVLSQARRTLRTEGNLNNHIGVPLTLFGLSTKHEAAVVEMGMSNPGEIARLAEIARPDIGVITNVGEAHLESMGDVEAVARAKGELLEALPAAGAAVLNRDDDLVMAQAGRTESRVITFGFSEDADVRAEAVEEREGSVAFDVVGDGRAVLAIAGRHNVSNALAALAAGRALGVPPDVAIEGLRSFRPGSMRMAVSEIDRLTILNDAYNSNPGSLSAAFATLAAQATGRRAWAALGDMLELGPRSESAHREAGAEAARLGVERLFLYGRQVAALREGAIAAGMPSDAARVFHDKVDLVRAIQAGLDEETVLLVKGSRGMRMEEVVERLVGEAPASAIGRSS